MSTNLSLEPIPGSLPDDPTHLSAHFGQCVSGRSRLHRIHGAAEAIDAFVLPRFLSTLAVLVAAIGFLLWLTR